MRGAIYLLCLLASVLCCWLLARSWRRTGARLLLWSMLCFVGLAVNNLLLVADALVFPTIDLLPFRHLTALGAVAILLWGFVWETN